MVFNHSVPLLIVYLAAGLRLLPGFVKLNSYLQQIESFKPSLNLIYKQLINQNNEFIVNKNDSLNTNTISGDIICKNINYAYEEKVIFD